MRCQHFALAVSFTLVGACASDDNTPSGNNNTAGPMSARINGAGWTASTAAALVAAPGVIVINASRLTTPNYALSFMLFNIGGTGAYALGVGANMIGGNVVASDPALGGWSTPQSGAAGELNITTLTSSRIAGTFSFTATPQSGSTGSLTVTGGSFDLPLLGTLAMPPANAGNKVTATIGGAAFNAAGATSVVSTGSTQTFALAALNLERNLSISLANVTAAGTYALSAATPVRRMQISGTPGNATATWGSQLAGGSGTVTITSFTTSRIIGTFSATLVPLGGGATGNLVITGNFDMGRQ